MEIPVKTCSLEPAVPSVLLDILASRPYKQIEIRRVTRKTVESDRERPNHQVFNSVRVNNSRNSRQSLFGGIGMTAVAKFDNNLQAIFGGHRCVTPCVRVVSLLETGEFRYRPLHTRIVERFPGR